MNQVNHEDHYNTSHPEEELTVQNGVILENGTVSGDEEEGNARKQRRLTECIVLNEDTTCGIGCCKGEMLQRFANKKAYVILYGILGCLFSAAYSYFNGTITTLEKRFRIPSKTTGKSRTALLFSSILHICF